jgi:hypothetical protein
MHHSLVESCSVIDRFDVSKFVMVSGTGLRFQVQGFRKTKCDRETESSDGVAAQQRYSLTFNP